MQAIFLDKINNLVGQEILVKGWVYNFRSSGSIYFLQVRDGAGFVQAIVNKNAVDEKVWQICEKLTIESSVELIGTVSKHPKREEYELQVKDLKIIQLAQEYPIGKKEHGPDF